MPLLGAYLKYPWLSKTIVEQRQPPANQCDKFGCYQVETEIKTNCRTAWIDLIAIITIVANHSRIYIEAADICYL